VTTRAANAASRVIALNAPDMRLLVAMAAEAYFVRARDRQLRRVYDFFRRNSLNVRACRAVTTFACMVFPASLLIEINGLVRVLLKGVENIFVAALADFGANVGFGPGVRSSGRRFGFVLLTSCGSRGDCEKNNHRGNPAANTAHATGPRRTQRWRCDKQHNSRRSSSYWQARAMKRLPLRDSRYTPMNSVLQD